MQVPDGDTRTDLKHNESKIPSRVNDGLEISINSLRASFIIEQRILLLHIVQILCSKPTNETLETLYL
jgi:hypothetical protein